MDDVIAVAIARIEAKLDAALAQGSDHEKRLRRLEGYGGKRWESLVGQIVTLIVAAVCGLVIGQFIK